MDQLTSVNNCLKCAQLQMASEALLRNGDTLHGTGTDLRDALVQGNKHASLFTQIQAAAFAAEWEVVDQRKNSPTGFSGTLFRHREANELVISFHSTELADDAMRDNQATTCVTPVGCHA